MGIVVPHVEGVCITCVKTMPRRVNLVWIKKSEVSGLNRGDV